MSPATTGLLVGLALGFAAAFGGFAAFAVVAVLGALGFAAGLVVDGRLDLSALTARSSGDGRREDRL